MLATTPARIQKRRSRNTSASDRWPPGGAGIESPGGGCAPLAGDRGGSARSVGRTTASHSSTQKKPRPPTTQNGGRHDGVHCKNASTISGVKIEPSAAPLCKMLLPSVRCSGGKIRCVVRKAHGQCADSIRPSKKRHTNSVVTVGAKPVAIPASDQSSTAVG